MIQNAPDENRTPNERNNGQNRNGHKFVGLFYCPADTALPPLRFRHMLSPHSFPLQQARHKHLDSPPKEE